MFRSLKLKRPLQSFITTHQNPHLNHTRQFSSSPPPPHPPPRKSENTSDTPPSSLAAPPPPTTPSHSPKTPNTKKPNFSGTPRCRTTSTRWSTGDANEKKQKIRPVGSGLSPYGIGLARGGMVNLALLDKVLEVDKEKKTVRVQAGIRVQELVDGIKDYGITLQNFASIREQQIGGIVQVCHCRVFK
ncbi:hypothetical protein L1987_32285 [Smallanthus sonchifolius]|uniref:Uncharacterized protein n=1 Tax=Smallanthus sonchifolius TaxID=185202 RepID=A0ACB9I9D5_9ASTR|nr:hypothetical protein L1987_32285 [Smallanthus sonchifolius]